MRLERGRTRASAETARRVQKNLPPQPRTRQCVTRGDAYTRRATRQRCHQRGTAVCVASSHPTKYACEGGVAWPMKMRELSLRGSDNSWRVLGEQAAE